MKRASQTEISFFDSRSAGNIHPTASEWKVQSSFRCGVLPRTTEGAIGASRENPKGRKCPSFDRASDTFPAPASLVTQTRSGRRLVIVESRLQPKSCLFWVSIQMPSTFGGDEKSERSKEEPARGRSVRVERVVRDTRLEGIMEGQRFPSSFRKHVRPYRFSNLPKKER
jgi:hypothetical protein